MYIRCTHCIIGYCAVNIYKLFEQQHLLTKKSFKKYQIAIDFLEIFILYPSEVIFFEFFSKM